MLKKTLRSGKKQEASDIEQKPRREVMTKMNWSLRALYRTLDEPSSNPLRGAHAKLDAAKEAAEEKITPLGLPLPVEEHGEFVTSDCISIEL